MNDVSEKIDINKSTGLCECIISYYWYLFEIYSRRWLRYIQKCVMVVLTKIIITITLTCSSKNVYINNINMTYSDKVDVSEGIDVNNISASKEHIISYYWYFLDEELELVSTDYLQLDLWCINDIYEPQRYC